MDPFLFCLLISAVVTRIPAAVADAHAARKAANAGEWDYLKDRAARKDARAERVAGWAERILARRAAKAEAKAAGGPKRPGLGTLLGDIYHGACEDALERRKERRAAREPFDAAKERAAKADKGGWRARLGKVAGWWKRKWDAAWTKVETKVGQWRGSRRNSKEVASDEVVDAYRDDLDPEGLDLLRRGRCVWATGTTGKGAYCGANIAPDMIYCPPHVDEWNRTCRPKDYALTGNGAGTSAATAPPLASYPAGGAVAGRTGPSAVAARAGRRPRIRDVEDSFGSTSWCDRHGLHDGSQCPQCREAESCPRCRRKYSWALGSRACGCCAICDSPTWCGCRAKLAKLADPPCASCKQPMSAHIITDVGGDEPVPVCPTLKSQGDKPMTASNGNATIEDVQTNEAARRAFEQMAEGARKLAEAAALAEAARAQIAAAALAAGDGMSAVKFDAAATASVADINDIVHDGTLHRWSEAADQIGAAAKAGHTALEKYRPAEEIVADNNVDARTVGATTS